MCNEFPQEGLALKPSDFLKFRDIQRLFQAPDVLSTSSFAQILYRICFRVAPWPIGIFVQIRDRPSLLWVDPAHVRYIAWPVEHGLDFSAHCSIQPSTFVQ